MFQNFNGAGRRPALSLFPRGSLLESFCVDNQMMSEWMAFKNTDKYHPARLQDIYGPYEVAIIADTGRLPNDWYVDGDPEPWGLSVEESRRTIILQAISGLLDRDGAIAADYFSLGLATLMSDEDYVKALQELNADWRKYGEHKGLFGNGTQSIVHQYRNVVCPDGFCPGCSLGAAVALRSEKMHGIFESLKSLKPQDRRRALADMQLLPELYRMIPDTDLKLELIKG